MEEKARLTWSAGTSWPLLVSLRLAPGSLVGGGVTTMRLWVWESAWWPLVLRGIPLFRCYVLVSPRCSQSRQAVDRLTHETLPLPLPLEIKSLDLKGLHFPTSGLLSFRWPILNLADLHQGTWAYRDTSHCCLPRSFHSLIIYSSHVSHGARHMLGFSWLRSASSGLCDRRKQWHPTPVLLPGKSHGRSSLVGCSPWGR